MQPAPLYTDIVARINQLQLVVNNLVAANAQTAVYLGTQLIPVASITALQSAMTTLQANAVTLNNTIPPIVAGD